jgi:predicted house-cleaning noncanonical NTP pyrophosphatase (MazG superfamily)
MTRTDKNTPAIIYRKLVRDRIPEIIRNHGKDAFTRFLDEEEFKNAVGRREDSRRGV